MNQLQNVFKYQNSQVRTLMINNAPWFVAKDVCEVLEISNSRDAIGRLEDDEKDAVGITDAISREQNMAIINEAGLYSLILTSRKPEAKAFKRWITHEVLPQLRKTGHYSLTELPRVEILRMALEAEEKNLALQRDVEDKNRQIEADKPKVTFAQAVETSDSSILVGNLAKILKQNGLDIGQNRLFKWLRDNGYLIKGGERMNMPTQRAMEIGLFEVKKSAVLNPDGSNRITHTTKVTGKGQIYFVNLAAEGKIELDAPKRGEGRGA